MSEMYDEIILDYYRNPRNFGRIEKPDAKARDVNISCGDEIEIQIKVKDEKISKILFNGKGCAISQAATSMLTEYVLGMPIQEAAQLKKEKVLELLNIPVSPMRLKCALLGFKVFKLCIYSYMGKEDENNE